MKALAYACPYCGSASLRRSRRQSVLEIGKMLVGTYPFRCLDCNQRVWVNIWLLSHLQYAKCPKCLSLKLGIPAPNKHYRESFWNNLLMTFGAPRYRCGACRYNFVSFRPREDDTDVQAKPAGREAIQPEPVTD